LAFNRLHSVTSQKTELCKLIYIHFNYLIIVASAKRKKEVLSMEQKLEALKSLIKGKP
jgi:hypothetical protein